MKRFISLMLALCLIFTIAPGVSQAAWADSEMAEEISENNGEFSIRDVIKDITPRTLCRDEEAAGSVEVLTDSAKNVLASGETVVDSGKCGDDITWTLGSQGTLTLSGTGSTWYDPYQEVAKWKDSAKILVIEEGITEISGYTFSGCYNLTDVFLPSTLTVIGECAFTEDFQIVEMEFPESIQEIGESAFFACTGLMAVYFYGDAPVIGFNAFYGDALAAYYDNTNASWYENTGTELDVRQPYGGRICWAAWMTYDDIPERMAGINRQATAVAISKAFSPEGSESVVIASGNNYPDALAGGPLAYLLGAPILLVSKGQLDPATVDEIRRLGAKHAYILGGPGAVSEGVSDTLRGMGLSVDRVAGADRFETATAIAKKIDELTGSKPEFAFFVYSHNYPDALAISNIAAILGAPILYIEGNGNLRAATRQYMDSCGAINYNVIIGGPGLISTNAEANISKYGYAERIYGNDRYETCIDINVVFRDILSGDSVCMACGTNYPDALSGGVLAADLRAPMVLVRGNRLTSLQEQYFDWRSPAKVFAFGGTGVLSQEIVEAAKYYSVYSPRYH